jgi:hypothetical protein
MDYIGRYNQWVYHTQFRKDIMNLYLISQNENNYYDTYEACVVCAVSKMSAQKMKPEEGDNGAWATKKENVKVEYLGKASGSMKAGFILKSFIAA